MKVILKHKEARDALLRGVDEVSDIVKLTLGPNGRNVVLGKTFQPPHITNDGVSIAKEVVLEDEIENLGADIIKEASHKTNLLVGDGTTTSTVLTQAIIHNCVKEESESFIKTTNAIALKNDIEATSKEVIKELIGMAKPIKTKKEIEKIASASIESDILGKKIADVVHKMGTDGVITTEEGSTFGIEVDFVEGMEISGGYISPFMANNKKHVAELENPYILITDHSINSVTQILPIIQKLNQQNIKELVIVANKYSEEVTKSMVVNKMNGVFTVLGIEYGVLGKTEKLEDIAALTGGALINKDIGKLEEVEIDHLGRADKIRSEKGKTTLIGGKGKHITKYVSGLKEKNPESEYDKEEIKKRIAKLSGGVAVVKVGASSESERSYLKDKVEDSINATKAAIEEGIVPGGGLALKKIAEKLPKNILTEALKAPYNQIQENAGGTLDISPDTFDPVKVTRIALENACGVAGIFLTTEAAVVDKNEKKCCHENNTA